MAYLCFDIGSSALKAAVLSEEGRLLSVSRSPVSLTIGPNGAHESNPRQWVSAALSSGFAAIAEARLAFPRLIVRALAVSGNGPTLLATDGNGAPIGPALSWLDRRAVTEAEEVSALARRTIDPSFYLPKALRVWRSASAAERKSIRWFFACPEYLLYALCGEAVTCLPSPGYEPYIWDLSAISALGLPADRFPPYLPPAAIAGRLLPMIADRLGIAAGIPAVVGFPDFLAAVVGSGSVEIGIACDRTGTSEALNLCADRPFPRRDLLSLPHPITGLWNVSGGVSTAGAALEWLASSLGYTKGEPPETSADIPALCSEAMRSPPGAAGAVFLPYLSGERAPLWNASRRAAFAGLSSSQGRPDLARAACESLAYGLRLSTDLARAEGFPIDLIRASGHAANDDFLCELKSDILGLPVEVPEITDCELAGDAAACACALGDAATISEAARAFVKVRRRFEPRASVAYEGAYEHFKDALAALEAVDLHQAELE